MDGKMLIARVDWQSCAALLARLCFAAAFGMNALVTFLRIDDAAEMFAFHVGQALAMPITCVFGIMAFLVSLSFLTGVWMRWAAAATIGIVFFFAVSNGREGNPHWFGTNISLTIYSAGLLYMIAYGPGRFALKLGGRRR
jgi:uncharacterized membrane protein YphA (DoxX/SURF4 family)